MKKRITTELSSHKNRRSRALVSSFEARSKTTIETHRNRILKDREILLLTSKLNKIKPDQIRRGIGSLEKTRKELKEDHREYLVKRANQESKC